MDEICRKVNSAVEVQGVDESLVQRFRDASQEHSIFSHVLNDQGAGEYLLWESAERAYKSGKALLSARGVATEPVKLDSGEAGIRILPGESSPLSRFAKEMEERYKTKVIYSPLALFKRIAGFHASSNSIYLPHDAVETNQIDESTLHEGLHAHFDHMDRNGKDSLFLGYFLPASGNKEGDPIWDNKHYSQHMSFEEIATYPDGLYRLGEILRSEIGLKRSDKVIEALANLESRSAIAHANYVEAHGVFKKALEALETNPREMRISYKENKMDNGETQKTLMASLTVGKVELYFPVIRAHEMTGELRAEIERQIRATGTILEDGGVTAFHDILRKIAKERLARLDRLVVELEKETQSLHEKTEKSITDMAHLTEILRLAPRAHAIVEPNFESPLPYLEIVKQLSKVPAPIR